MPITPTYPGVYIEEIPSGVRTLTGVATSVTAFIGRAKSGPVNEPTLISSYADFERQFGGLWIESALSYAVRDFFLNGGGQAVIVRLYRQDGANAGIASGALGTATLTAANPGAWGNKMSIIVDHDVADDAGAEAFNLTVNDPDSGKEETFRNVLLGAANAKHPRYLLKVLENQSTLVRLTTDGSGQPDESNLTADPPTYSLTGGHDGLEPEAADYLGNAGTKQGLYALEKADLFNLLCIPDILEYNDLAAAATAYCEKRRAMLIIDSREEWGTVQSALTGIETVPVSSNSAIFFPRLMQPDPLRDGQLVSRPSCGAIAGVIARTDGQRGIWKAPAGLDAVLVGVPKLSIPLTDAENGRLNPLGINCMRTMPAAGRVVWGARTRRGDDRLSSEWKYIPVRRVALYIEESLYRGTQWVVFEPNDEPLWAQIRLNVGAFMNDLFRKGAFQGQSPGDAYFVKCDKETTTQSDINLGIVNIMVGFAPLKPAEFVIIKLQQMAGQIAA